MYIYTHKYINFENIKKLKYLQKPDGLEISENIYTVLVPARKFVGESEIGYPKIRIKELFSRL